MIDRQSESTGAETGTGDTYSPFGYVAAVSRDATSTPTRDSRAEWFANNLVQFLLFMVPLCIQEMHDWPADRIDRARRDAVHEIACHGDDLQFGGGHQRSSRTALARALAILARAEGGGTTLGVHACLRPHIDCPRFEHRAGR
ncbi:hypothetical protein [Nocardia transvalensis]|uniref:hypothetical protein n=1 Tax=Nocardia transvalensis TaxID=37333 RepID=UPI0018944458|nr:hypothetical protein [Nocardia transvalensis]MBF6333500.1 hypothetical protein [Nocardia transvalensis]